MLANKLNYGDTIGVFNSIDIDKNGYEEKVCTFKTMRKV